MPLRMHNFKAIKQVPALPELVDMVLSKTQRKTPTVVRKAYEITRIREFYIKKVRFTQETFSEKINAILHEFPRLDEIHPFYSDLMNVLYDRDHYKVALAQLNTAKRLVEAVSTEYTRFLKHADSLYRCKRLKIAALGRMVKIVKKNREGLSYLEQVRQHLTRVPEIDPNTRTLVLCGYPNVGKSSFMNKLTRADVDVQAYPFTTKSLYVGHMDYNYLRWQVLDTPGILDRPLEQRNTIEMQAITALAHLKAAILYFFDLSQTCGYSIEQQVSLFQSIRPLFADKQLVVILSKKDLKTVAQLSDEERNAFSCILDGNYPLAMISSVTSDGIFAARNLACDLLLKQRTDCKKETGAVKDVLGRLYVSHPGMDNRTRQPLIPESVSIGKKKKKKILEKDIEQMNGGAGVYSADLKKGYFLNEDEKHDVFPEIVNGKNVLDFVSPELDEKINLLGLEEEYLKRTGAYDIGTISEEKKQIRELNEIVERRKGAYIERKRLDKRGNRKLVLRRIEIARKNKELSQQPADTQLEDFRKKLLERAKRVRKNNEKKVVLANSGHVTSPSFETNIKDRRLWGIGNERDLARVNKILKLMHRKHRFESRQGEADRQIPEKKPKHLFSGKMCIGKRNHR